MSGLAPVPMEAQPVAAACLEISVKGKWVSVPALNVDGNIVTIKGKWTRIASVHDEEWLVREVAEPSIYLEILKRSTVARADVFTFMQKLPAVVPKYTYPLELQSVAVVKIPSFEEWWQQLPQETRKNVRRSQKRGVEIRVQPFDDDAIRGIAGVQNECPVRQGRRYPHYGKSLEQVRRDHSAFVDRSDFICAYSGDEFIGFLKLVYRGDVASILQLNSKVAHYDKRPSNALLAKAVELCAAHGVSHLTYGRFNYGNKSDSSLRDFKVRNGFRELLVPRYYVPLSAWGRFYVQNKLYRGLMEFLPRSVITTLLNVRARWYYRQKSQ